MKVKHLIVIVSCWTMMSCFNGFAQISTPLYTVSPFSGEMHAADTTIQWFPSADTVDLTTVLENVASCQGMAVQPCTGDIYIAYYSSSFFTVVLGILDPKSGVITNVGPMGDYVTSICFGSETQLYAVTADWASFPETLYKVDIGTAALTPFVVFGYGDVGEDIAFNSDDGKIYHWSGTQSAQIMESIDTATGAITPIPLWGGNWLDEIYGSTYVGNNEFLVCTEGSDYQIIDITGYANPPFTNAWDDLKGLCFPKSYIAHQLPTDTICNGDTIVLSSIYADSYQWIKDGTIMPGEIGPNINVSSSGDYQVETSVDGCTYLSDTISITVQNSFNVGISPSPNAYLCVAGDSTLLVGSPGGVSQWTLNGSIIAGATSDSLWVQTAGHYNMTKTNINGCVDSAVVGTYVDFPPTLAMTPADSVTFCTSDSSIVTATTGATSYQWYFNGSFLIVGATSPTYYVSTIGTYTVSAMFGNCPDSTSTALVAVEDNCGIGLEEDYFGSLNIFPVPAKDNLNIEFTSQGPIAQFQIVGLDGKIIRSKLEITNEGKFYTTISLNGLAEGFYVLKIIQNGKVLSKPILIN